MIVSHTADSVIIGCPVYARRTCYSIVTLIVNAGIVSPYNTCACASVIIAVISTAIYSTLVRTTTMSCNTTVYSAAVSSTAIAVDNTCVIVNMTAAVSVLIVWPRTARVSGYACAPGER
jgi:hypothetical protein